MTTRWIGSGFVIAACGLMLAGAACGADQVSPAAQEEAQNIFKARCTMCHGALKMFWASSCAAGETWSAPQAAPANINPQAAITKPLPSHLVVMSTPV